MSGYFLRAQNDFSISPQRRLSNILNARQRVKCAKFLLKNKQFLFLKLGQGIQVFEETQKSNQDVIGDVYCPICPMEKCVLL